MSARPQQRQLRLCAGRFPGQVERLGCGGLKLKRQLVARDAGRQLGIAGAFPPVPFIELRQRVDQIALRAYPWRMRAEPASAPEATRGDPTGPWGLPKRRPIVPLRSHQVVHLDPLQGWIDLGSEESTQGCHRARPRDRPRPEA